MIVRAADLSLQTLIEKIGPSRPLRDLTGHESMIEVLEDASLRYAAAAAAAK